MANYQMIVLDLDGTLTNSEKQITKRTKDALMEAQRQGKTVVLASGRPTHGILFLAEELELEKFGGYVLAFNGGLVMNCKTGEILFQKLLPVSANPKIAKAAQNENADLLTYQDDMIITNNRFNQYVQAESRITHLGIKEVDDLASYVDFPVSKFLILEEPDRLVEIEKRVKKSFGEAFSVYRSAPFFLDIMPQNIDKAQSLEQLIQQLGIPREEVIACGDGHNDLDMIRFAGLGVAMANAVEPLREIADYITYSNDEDGIAHVVETFMLN